MASQNLKLHVIKGTNRGSVFALRGEIITIGRNPENDVVINDAAASRFHARIERRGDQFFILDLGSTHGTFVNEVRNNQEMMLSSGDHIRIGISEMVFQSRWPGESLETIPLERVDDGSLIGGERPRSVDLPGDTVAFSLPAVSHSSAGLSESHAERLSRVADAIQSVLDLDDLLAALMSTIFEVFAPERGIIFLRDEESGALLPRVQRPEGDIGVSQTIVDFAVENRSSLLVSDVAGDERFADAESVMAQSIRSAICSPLVSKERVLGVLYIDTQSHRISYRSEDLALLNLIAANAAIAIENAILVREKLEAERLAAMGVAVAGISHCAKNILAGIMGGASLIDMGLDTENWGMVREAWPILKRSNQRITALVQDMLSYSKRREPSWEQGNLNDLLRDIHANQAARAQEAGVELALELDGSLPASEFDHTGIHDTLLNIVGNAVEACAELSGGRVTLRSEIGPAEGQLCVSISDSGPGIPAALTQRIFEPFFSTKGSKGTGLGLAVAHKTVREHGGDLTLESTEGEGTTFRVILPLSADHADKTAH
ncbi:FHA domain-containing protein [Candidatus Sumerlaeota bacterium]|nr:FHA domain-containing protein [Candidatus Sumerlaeota bacterium]